MQNKQKNVLVTTKINKLNDKLDSKKNNSTRTKYFWYF